MAQKKTGNSVNSNLQGDSLIVNNGLTASSQFLFEGGSDLVFKLPTVDGSSGYSLITDGAGQLSFGTVSNQGNVLSPSGGGTTPKLSYWTGSQSLGDSDLEQGTGQLLFPGGSAPAPGISFQLDTDTGMIRSGVNTVGIVGGGVKIADFNSNGITVGAVTYTKLDGTSGQALTTDGSGNLSWSSFYGATGATGPQGEIGVTGATGADSTVVGPTGATGPDGANGANGATGATGATGGIDQSFMYQSGEILGASFSGTPTYYDVTFNGIFVPEYVVSVDSEVPRDWTVFDKTTTGFRLCSESTSTFTQSVWWNAIEVSDSTMGALIGPAGPTGPQGIQGIQGPTGSAGVNGATGATGADFTGLSAPVTLTDAATINWDYTTGYNAQVTITATRALSITGVTAGDYGTLLITQGGSGGYSITFGGSDKLPSGTSTFTSTVGKSDLYGFYYNGTYFYWTFKLNY